MRGGALFKGKEGRGDFRKNSTEGGYILLISRRVSVPYKGKRALKKVPVFGKTNKKAASYCTSEQFSDGQILSLFCLTQWLRYLYDDLQRVI